MTGAAKPPVQSGNSKQSSGGCELCRHVFHLFRSSNQGSAGLCKKAATSTWNAMQQPRWESHLSWSLHSSNEGAASVCLEAAVIMRSIVRPENTLRNQDQAFTCGSRSLTHEMRNQEPY